MTKLIESVEEVEKSELSYQAEGEELEVLNFVTSRIDKMKSFRKDVMGKDIDKIFEEADVEYQPSELVGQGGKIFETDSELGLRSHLVIINGVEQEWRSHNKDPMLYNKIQTALSILIDREPEAFFTAMSKKYEATNKLAHSLWKNSWVMDQSKQQLKLFIFNLAKYGWAIGRTYPRIIKRKKKILTEIDTENPDNNKWTEKEICDFNGIHRENLDPHKTWIDEMSRPNEPLSTNDWYFEKDYSEDQAELEFGLYNNWKFLERGNAKVASTNEKIQEKNDRKDIVTLGFYENRTKDLFCILAPSKSLVLSFSPLPNDEGQLSLWHTYWTLRDARTPYGIGLWDIIKKDKELFDKMYNMTMDQLVLSIYKMFFYSGTSNLMTGDGTITIEPGKGRQNLGGKIDWLEVPGPGKEAWDGLRYQKSRIDDNSGITPTMEGEVTGKTLGEILHAKEAALKKLNLPLGNIAEALETEAYTSLSWLAQTLSIPEVKEFANEEELKEYEKESGLNKFAISPVQDKQGNQTGVQGVFYPQVALNVDFDKGDNLIEVKETRFFQIENDIPADKLKWRGIIKVEPRSIITPSIELDRQRKSEIFNIIIPLLPNDPAIFLKSVEQLLKINDEEIEDWLPDSWIQFKEGGSNQFQQQQAQASNQAEPLFVKQGENPTQPPTGGTMQNQAGTAQIPSAPTVVPPGQIGGGGGNMLSKLKSMMGAFRK